MDSHDESQMGEGTDPLIAIDACFLTDFPRSSLAVYLRSLLNEWQNLEHPPRILLFVPRLPDEISEPLLNIPNVHLAMPDCPARPASRFMALLIWQQWTIPLLLRKHRPTVYFSPFHFTPLFTWGTRVVTTIHDLCFLSENKFSIGSLTHRIQVISACLSAKRIICVSRYTSAILRQWWRKSAEKSVVVQNGCDSTCFPQEAAVLLLSTECGDIQPYQYFIWIGHPSPRKNIEGLIDSFRLYQQEKADGKRLVLVAPEQFHAKLSSLAEERGIKNSLVLLSGISTPLRDALYRCATALVFPSHCEGFGYPVLEAMTQGCPPISYRHGPSGEIVGRTFPLAEKLEPDEFCRIMILAANMSPEERLGIAHALMQRASGFSIRTMAEKTLNVLRESI
jgi:alpha-1,3-rhamnosyl/mannosyltransferase